MCDQRRRLHSVTIYILLTCDQRRQLRVVLRVRQHREHQSVDVRVRPHVQHLHDDGLIRQQHGRDGRLQQPCARVERTERGHGVRWLLHIVSRLRCFDVEHVDYHDIAQRDVGVVLPQERGCEVAVHLACPRVNEPVPQRR